MSRRVSGWLKVFFGFFCLAFFFFPRAVHAATSDIMINEIMVHPASGDDEWIELFNVNEAASQDLSGLWLMVTKGTEPNYTHQERIDLSGTLPRQGFLTFTLDGDDTLPNDGACISVFITTTSSVFSLKYGNGTCDAGVDAVDATSVGVEQGKSINAKESWVSETVPPQATWSLTESTSKGWCDTSNTQCPTISSIITELSGEGVTTNLDDQSDMSRTSGLYFTRTNYGEILFSSEINFTDMDALTWMEQLNENLSISQGIINLDADLVNNLIDTQATLTMENIDFNNPKILVDDQDDTGGIVSSLVYDQENQSLSFTVAHFTKFTAIETPAGLSEAGPPVCGDWPPTNAPHLFQIDTSQDEAVLYFSPVSDHLSYYFIAYGLSEDDERFGIEFPAGLSTGVVSYTVKALAANTTYYFKVRGGNGCAAGPWSNYLAAVTEGSVSQGEASVVSVAEPATEEEVSSASPSLIMGESDSPEDEEVIETSPEPEPEPQADVAVEPKLSFWQKILNFFRRLLGRH